MNRTPDITDNLEKCRERLSRLCITLCRNMHDAEDLFQDTCFRAFRYYRRYDSEKSFENWIMKICVNTYKTGLKSKYRNPSKTFDTEEEHDLFFSEIPDCSSEASVKYRELVDAVNHLPEKYRTVLLIRYFSDYSEEDTSRILGIPKGTVKSRLNRAKTLLREVMDNEQRKI